MCQRSIGERRTPDHRVVWDVVGTKRGRINGVGRATRAAAKRLCHIIPSSLLKFAKSVYAHSIDYSRLPVGAVVAESGDVRQRAVRGHGRGAVVGHPRVLAHRDRHVEQRLRAGRVGPHAAHIICWIRKVTRGCEVADVARYVRHGVDRGAGGLLAGGRHDARVIDTVRVGARHREVVGCSSST